jgi:hypothetical protein
MDLEMKKVLVIILLLVMLVVSTVGCTSSRSDRQLARIEAQIQALTSSLASTQQELASAKQALAEAQEKARLLQQQQQQPPPASASSSIGTTTYFATSAVYTTAPSIANFTANPTVIMPGQSSTLQWNVTGADSVSIDPGIGTVPYAGGRLVYPTTSTTYILTATNSYTSVTAYATVTIQEVYQPPSYSYYSNDPYYVPPYTPPAPRPAPAPRYMPRAPRPTIPAPRYTPPAPPPALPPPRYMPHPPPSPRLPFPPPPTTGNSTRPRPPFPR